MSWLKLSIIPLVHQVNPNHLQIHTLQLLRFITLSDFELSGSIILTFTSGSNTSLDRRLECFSVAIVDDDIVEPLETISLLFGRLDPPAPQVQPTGNGMIVIEDNDCK